jgi:cytochrome oxidase assembly protein ShyY1
VRLRPHHLEAGGAEARDLHQRDRAAGGHREDHRPAEGHHARHARGAPEGDEGDVMGTTQMIPSRSDHGRPLRRNGATTWARLDSTAIAERVPVLVMDAYVVQEEVSPRSSFPRRVELPALDDGPHLSYAIQWFAFATIALGGAGLWLRKGRGSRVMSRES